MLSKFRALRFWILYLYSMDKKKTYLAAIIDKLTNSIENSITGDTFDTEIINILNKDKKHIIKGE